VICETAEQLFALLGIAKEVYSDRYHPGVLALRLGLNVTLLEYNLEASKLKGLQYQLASKTSKGKDSNLHAFEIVREKISRLQQGRTRRK